MAIFSKLKQYKDLRSEAKKFQSTMATENVHGEAAGGKIHIIMDGNQDIMAIDIADELLNPAKKKEVEDGLKKAFADAVKKIQRVMAEKVRKGDLSLPKF